MLVAADLLGFLPADWLALGALTACGTPCLGSGATGWAGSALEWLPMLRLLHLARLYRLRQLFSYLVRDMHLGVSFCSTVHLIARPVPAAVHLLGGTAALRLLSGHWSDSPS